MVDNRTQTPRIRLLIALFVALGAFSATLNPVGAQAGNDEQQLEAQEAALQSRIGELVTSIEDLEFEQSQLTVEIETLAAAIEGSADALEELALARRAPARQRIALALERFINGDPAAEAFARELQALDRDDGPLQQQQVLNEVGRAAQDELVALDAQITLLAADVPTLRADLTEAVDQLTAADAAMLELRFELDEARNNLEAVSLDLEWYRSTDGRSPITGRDNPNGNNRPALVIKIDNVPRARPQAGVNDADLVFVELVEGGATRLAAVYHSEEVGTVGPVRSMRTTDVKILQMLNQPLFANSGGNARTTQIVNQSPLINIGHATGAGGAYYRNNSRTAPHNLFTSTGALRGQAGTRGGAPPEIFTIRRPGTALANPSEAADGVYVNYPSTNVVYSWNGTGWQRSQDGAAFNDAAGVRVAPETVIVQFTAYGVSPADANSPEAVAVGSGAAWIFTEGVLIRGTWEKPRARAVTVYRDTNGDVIELLPGRIWVEIPEPGSASVR
jgi:hypothetical protein